MRATPFAFVVIWASGFVVAKYAAPYAEPLSFLVLRYAGVVVLMLALAEWVAGNFSIDGFWTYVGATIVVWLVNVIVGALLDRIRGFD